MESFMKRAEEFAKEYEALQEKYQLTVILNKKDAFQILVDESTGEEIYYGVPTNLLSKQFEESLKENKIELINAIGELKEILLNTDLKR